MKVFVTGSAGFIGFHLARRLLARGDEVLGFDAMTPYYDVELKRARQDLLAESSRFKAVNGKLEDFALTAKTIADFVPDVVVHLAAQAGVRYSITHPEAYIDANILGTFGVLQACRQTPPRHLLMASTSSVYGGNDQMPFREVDKADLALTLYAATKKSTESMAHSYAHLYGIPTTMLRFFTVYGPWGRPDMALFKFTRGILADEPIEIYNQGEMVRDFTYVDDLVTALTRLMDAVPGEKSVDAACDTLSPVAPYRVVNIGGGAPVGLLHFVDVLEKTLGKAAKRNYLPMQIGDVPETSSSAELLERLTGYVPATPVEEGVPAFVEWYRGYYRV